jgi:hypothetical protein
MFGLRLVSLTIFVLATALVLLSPGVHALDPRAMHDSLVARYTTAHSLGDNYQFNPRDGWQSVNASNLQYKYSRDYSNPDDDDGSNVLAARDSKTQSKSKSKSSSKSKSKSKPKPKSSTKAKSSSASSKVSKVTSSVKKIVDSLKGVGETEPVTITWYTGHDLENPSCWPNPTWAPTVRLGHAEVVSCSLLLGCFYGVCLDSGRLED